MILNATTQELILKHKPLTATGNLPLKSFSLLGVVIVYFITLYLYFWHLYAFTIKAQCLMLHELINKQDATTLPHAKET